LDTLAKEYMKKSEGRPDLLAKIQELIKKKPADSKYYLQFMKKIESNGNDYVKKELKRLESVLGKKDQMSGEKIDSFYIRKNILRSFDEL
jgi:N-methylhydantoinase B/oxoprolinase/acetone carboxylase alpha subunit